ncbi:MAG: hypothetical protein P0Y56_12680 [Candidatus Andeanibacterium colombiense]|uniref:TonB C-terminal domain-containing protein n=1 Tax=Candidatus Andeanibacterium colombiense TaxID=3121345 RepID=A0AAJ5X7A7_9SPHN|nr:MAG: hypothetical protein P0Y56_12680 [Sphingomonadaceae bacterium]
MPRLADRHRPNWGTLAFVVSLHLLAILGLARAFAPALTARALDRVAAVLTVTVAAPEEKPVASSQPDAGAAAPPGPKLVPRAVSAQPKLPLKQADAPPVAGSGMDVRSGAATAGAGSGAAGTGIGSGSGSTGNGQGSGGRKLEKIAGAIDSASDYPVPPGGREARFGTSVTIALTVGPDGLPRACRVIAPSPFPETDATTCRLALERFRFRSATGPDGTPVTATYGWRQQFRKMR